MLLCLFALAETTVPQQLTVEAMVPQEPIIWVAPAAAAALASTGEAAVEQPLAGPAAVAATAPLLPPVGVRIASLAGTSAVTEDEVARCTDVTGSCGLQQQGCSK